MPKRPKKNSGPQYGGPGRGTRNKFSKHFYLTSRYLNCEHCGQKVFSSKIDSSKASLMLRHWAHSKICKEMRAARGIVVDRMFSDIVLTGVMFHIWTFQMKTMRVMESNFVTKWKNRLQLMFVLYSQTVKTTNAPSVITNAEEAANLQRISSAKTPERPAATGADIT